MAVGYAAVVRCGVIAVSEITGFFLERSRFAIFVLLSAFVVGIYSYYKLPREKIPGVKAPIICVTAAVEGATAELAEVLLALPMERELQSVGGIKKITSIVRDGVVSVVLELRYGFDVKAAMADVRSRLDVVRPKLPRNVTSLMAEERNLGLLPVLKVAITGDLPTGSLHSVARELKYRIESLSDVFKVNAVGLRNDVIELGLVPELMDHYGIQIQDIVQAVARNHALIDYGVLESQAGRHKIRVNGLLDSRQQILDVVLKVNGDAAVTVSDVATVKLALEDPTELARINGKRCIVLEISKKSGSNIAEVAGRVTAFLEGASKFLPEGASLFFVQDQSKEVSTILRELENAVAFSVLLVLLVIMAFMGIRTAVLVALSIPISFLLGIMVIYVMGYTLNIVILFTLIMVVGMLVDDAIIVSEYADRKMVYGFDRQSAYKMASLRMFWPMASSTMTRLVVFIPLLFWPGVTGEFMKYIPVVSISTLAGSWIAAIAFTPVLGSVFGKPSAMSREDVSKLNAVEDLRIDELSPAMRLYSRVLCVVLDYPKSFVCATVAVLMLSTAAYFTIGPGVEFFPNIEPDRAVVEIRSDSNMSLQEKDKIVKAAEAKIMDVAGIKFLYSLVGHGWDEPKNTRVIGAIDIEFQDWYLREKSTKLLAEVAERLKGIAGVTFDVKGENMRPNRGKPLEVNLRSEKSEDLEFAADLLVSAMNEPQGFTDVVRDNFLAGTEWSVDVDRKKAASFGADVMLIGQFVKMLTGGAVVGKYYPEGAKDEVAIIARFREGSRSLKGLDRISINTAHGPVPAAYFVQEKVKRGVDMIKRVDGLRSLTIYSNLLPGYLVGDRVQYLKGILEKRVGSKVTANFLGDMESQEESREFLITAFCLVILLITLVLVGELNNFYYVAVVMTAVFLATTCVFLGFLVTYKVFGIVMGGVGIIVLSGVVVNNNILLVDAYRENLETMPDRKSAILKSALSRLRPIFLTVITGVLGLLPMVLKISIDFFGRKVLYDSPSSQLWFELSITTSVGLLLATVITLLFTPAILMLGEERGGGKEVSVAQDS
ncbi:efflux RND transporter permease subunit [Anaplasma capra]|nr:efflux RND transporter permease subunit [Anaplasma capra]